MSKVSSTQPKKEEFSEQSIQKRLSHFFASKKYDVDGLFVFSWESDKLLWTKAGYIYEFEIKISRADYRNDFKHKGEKHLILSSTIARERQQAIQQDLFEQKKKEHPYWSDNDIQRVYGDTERIIKGRKMPNYFYYAVPEGMIQPEEVPPYAGLVWMAKEYRYCGGIIIKKKAPMLHKTKYTDGELNLGEKFYYNWLTARRNFREAEKSVDYFRTRLENELAAKNQEMTYDEMAFKLKIAESSRDEYKEKWGKQLRDGIADRAELKRLKHEIKKLQPDFDLQAITDEVDKLYGIDRK
jgi:hypothetical protein